MAFAEQTTTEQITLTAGAAQAVQDLLTQRNLLGYALRVFVSGGGCSGLQYGLALEAHPREQDTVYDQHGVRLVVDEVSINYLRGATIDYVDDLLGHSGFKIENPNAAATCGCGQSFESESGGCSSGGCSCS
jgi:iron-sulfur cluster assembly protein